MPNTKFTPLAGVRAGSNASKLLKKSIIKKAIKEKKAVKVKAPRAIPIHGPSDTGPAPKALPTSIPFESPDARFRGWTPKLGGSRIKVDKDGKETGVPYYAPPAKKR